jgi:hypothetical protein
MKRFRKYQRSSGLLLDFSGAAIDLSAECFPRARTLSLDKLALTTKIDS